MIARSLLSQGDTEEVRIFFSIDSGREMLQQLDPP